MFWEKRSRLLQLDLRYQYRSVNIHSAVAWTTWHPGPVRTSLLWMLPDFRCIFNNYRKIPLQSPGLRWLVRDILFLDQFLWNFKFCKLEILSLFVNSKFRVCLWTRNFVFVNSKFWVHIKIRSGECDHEMAGPLQATVLGLYSFLRGFGRAYERVGL